jgi:gas vesicle protein
MGKFIAGLIIGGVAGILAMAANPNLPQELRVSLAGLTAAVMRNAEETAEQLGDAAEDLADEAGEAADAARPPAATAPAAPTEGQKTGVSL